MLSVKAGHMAELRQRMYIRKATIDDLEEIAKVEAECFPAAEAATKEEIRERLQVFPDHFWLLFDGDTLVSFIDGAVTDREYLTDDMYADSSIHDEKGAWQMIYGVNTIPSYRRQGNAGRLMKKVIEDARAEGRKGVLLTCKKEKIPFYTNLGYKEEGVANSDHGGAVWYNMRITF